jgi:hypothetical protein
MMCLHISRGEDRWASERKADVDKRATGEAWRNAERLDDFLKAVCTKGTTYIFKWTLN